MKLFLNTTTYKREGVEKQEIELNFVIDKEIENELLNIYPQVEYQCFEGFGGALTDAAGFVYAQMSDEDKRKMIDTYFGKKGIGYNRVRIPVDSCDFSVEQFQAISEKDDPQFKTFSLDREKKYIYPLWEDVKKTALDVDVMVTPWSPPDFMKTNEMRVKGGHIKDEYKETYAEYLCHYIKELRKIGIPVSRMSVQNEPKAVQTWDSCIMDAQEEKTFLRDYLYPAMEKNDLTDVEIFIWDHNKERVFERACEIIDDTTAHIIKGIAFHWYSGDHFETLQMVKEKFPDLKLMLSEACIEYSKFADDGEIFNVKKYAHDIIGNLNAGMNAFYDWNVLLDHAGGPNHVGNFCDAPFMYHLEEKKLEERMTLSAIAHFSRYIKQGAVRIGQSRYTDKLETTAFKNPDGSIVVVLLNQTEEAVPVTLRVDNKCASVKIEALSLATAIITES